MPARQFQIAGRMAEEVIMVDRIELDGQSGWFGGFEESGSRLRCLGDLTCQMGPSYLVCSLVFWIRSRTRLGEVGEYIQKEYREDRETARTERQRGQT